MTEKMLHDEYNPADMFPSLGINAVPSNPLKKYFRVPYMSVSLPTNGRYFPVGGIELDAMGQVGVYPMKASDEILLAAPDALMNGDAVAQLLASCVPQIKRPDMICAPDLDVLLLAIRAASTGPTMEMEANCPACDEVNAYEINLPAMLSTMKTLPDNNSVVLGEMEIHLRPHFMTAQTNIMIEAYKMTRHVQAIEADETSTDDDKKARISAIVEAMTKTSIRSVCEAIIKIQVPEAIVTDKKYIMEYLSDADAKTISALNAKLTEINGTGIDKNIDMVCSKCKHEWHNPIEFNPSTFFGQGS